MKDVLIIEHIYPCRSYALKRIGRDDLLTLDWLKNEFPKLLQKYKDDMELEVGDILVWKNANANNIYCPVSIQGNEVIFEQIKYAYHCGVYEGSGFVSDCVLAEINLPLVIRKRKLNQLSRPDCYLRLEHE